MEVVFNNVSFSYDGNCVFDNFSCFIKQNIISCIIGASGSGKSTMLDLIDGLLECSNGYVSVGSIRVCENVRKSIGYLFQFSSDQIFNSTVYKEIEYGLKNFGCDNIDLRIRNSLQLVGLSDDFLYLNPSKISSGQRRKIA